MAIEIAVILVRPEIPENLGFVARSLACYGFHDLRCVGIEKPSSTSVAWRTSSGGEAVLNGAKYFGSLAEALEDCHTAFGFSRRPHREAESEILESVVQRLQRELAPLNSSTTIRLGLIFGPESKGLQRADAQFIPHWIRIDYPHETLSLNLSHAIAIALHSFYLLIESFKIKHEGKDPNPTGFMADTRANLGLMQKGIELALELTRRHSIYPESKRAAQEEHLRALWHRLQLTKGEAEFIVGTLKGLF